LARPGDDGPRSPERPSLGAARALLPVSVPASVVSPTVNEEEEDLEATGDGALLRGAARSSGSERLWLQPVLALAAVMLLATATSARDEARSRRWETTRPQAGRRTSGALVGRARSAGHAVRRVIATICARVSAAPPISAAGANARRGARAPNRTGTHDGVALGSAAPIGAYGVARGLAHQRPRIKALACDLYVEAESRDRSVGTVKGFVIAFACRQHRRGADTYLLVNDPSKLAAVWVKESEIQLRSVAAQPRSRKHEP